MSRNNRDDFDQCAALVFNLLYKAFPIEIDVVVDELLVESYNEDKIDNYLATIRFLQREGFIRYQEFYYNVFKGTVLTAKGLKVLDSLSENSDFDETGVLIQAIDDKSAIRTTIQEFIRRTVAF
jgi:hypothetical protein